jgi:DNA-binding LytR/AlgR family response regulator
MQNYNCLIVEDEPLAAEVLRDYVEQVPFLQLAGICTDAIYASEKLHESSVQLLFLDIHLPKLKGLDFLKTLKYPPQVIITSAYPEYALKGYEFNVLDYLLKPIEFTRFLMAVNKLQAKSFNNAGDIRHLSSAQRPHLFFNVSKKQVRIYIDEILFIESLKEYIRVCTTTKTILTKMSLNQIEEILTPYSFLRIHRSFLVAKDKIDAFTASDIEINKNQLPIGRNYKELVLAALQA